MAEQRPSRNRTRQPHPRHLTLTTTIFMAILAFDPGAGNSGDSAKHRASPDQASKGPKLAPRPTTGTRAHLVPRATCFPQRRRHRGPWGAAEARQPAGGRRFPWLRISPTFRLLGTPSLAPRAVAWHRHLLSCRRCVARVTQCCEEDSHCTQQHRSAQSISASCRLPCQELRTCLHQNAGRSLKESSLVASTARGELLGASSSLFWGVYGTWDLALGGAKLLQKPITNNFQKCANKAARVQPGNAHVNESVIKNAKTKQTQMQM